MKFSGGRERERERERERTFSHKLMNDNEKITLMHSLKQKQMHKCTQHRRCCVTNEMGVPVSHYIVCPVLA